MPTFDAENQVRYSKEDRPFVAVSRNGELLPEVRKVIALIAKHHLVLATGHSSADEGLLLIREARRQGVDHIVVTHAMLDPVLMTIPQMREAAGLGAFIEFVYNALIGPNKSFDMPDYAKAIRAVGINSTILSSDLGQAVNPLHPDGLAAFFGGLKKQGFTDEEIGRMSKVNPAKLLRISESPTEPTSCCSLILVDPSMIARPPASYMRANAATSGSSTMRGPHPSYRLQP
jgi:hypothetical protein